MNTERKESLLRIPIGILSYIILELWGILVMVLMIWNFFYTLIKGDRDKKVAEFTNHFITYLYSVMRYLSFNTNKRPFPFNDFSKSFEKYDRKKKQ